MIYFCLQMIFFEVQNLRDGNPYLYLICAGVFGSTDGRMSLSKFFWPKPFRGFLYDGGQKTLGNKSVFANQLILTYHCFVCASSKNICDLATYNGASDPTCILCTKRNLRLSHRLQLGSFAQLGQMIQENVRSLLLEEHRGTLFILSGTGPWYCAPCPSLHNLAYHYVHSLDKIILISQCCI